MDKLSIKSFAKINIGLNILFRRDDGFHNLETIFFPLNLHDELLIEKSDNFSFSSNDKALEIDKSNLIIKSHNKLEKYFDKKLTVKITLDKKIPIGAGMGGGSSNAAAVINGLLNLFNLSIPDPDLKEIALSIGSDVPFFINPVPSFAESRGEILTPINLKINKYLLVVNPGIHISTKWAFSLIKPKNPSVSLKSIVNKDFIKIDDLFFATNDFEKIVFDHFSEIKEIKMTMLRFESVFSLMTGTGSTVWGFFEDEESANLAELYFKCRNYFTYLQSPT